MNRKLISIVYILLAAGLFFTACSPDDQMDSSTREKVNTNYVQLNQRIEFKNEAVPLQRLSSQVDPPNLTLVAEVLPPSLNGDQLHAGAVDIKGNYAYVTYHRKFEPYGGIVDVIDLSTPSNPVIVCQLQIADTDFYTVDASENNQLILAGARSIDESGYTSPANHKGAVVHRIQLYNGLINQSSLPITETPLNSFAATSTVVHDGFVLASTGDQNGGIYALDLNSFSVSVDPDFKRDNFYAEFVNVSSSGRVVYLQGSQSNAAVMHYGEFDGGDGFSNMSTTNIPYNTTFVGKNGVEIYGNTAYVALGDDGIMQFDLQTGSYETPVNYNNQGRPASATADADYLYVANGFDGMLVLDRNEPGMPLLGTWNFADEANVIKTNGTYVFVAHGLGGLKILKIGVAGILDCENTNFPEGPDDKGANLNVTSLVQFSEPNGGGEVKNLTISSSGQLDWCGDLKVEKNATVSGDLNLVGEMEIKRSLWVNSGGNFQVEGELKVKRQTVLNDTLYVNGDLIVEDHFHINSGGYLKIKGNLTIKDNLNLNGKIEFIGTNNTVEVDGRVNRGSSAQVIGTYTGDDLD